jgi:hypothetical protein
MKLYTSECSGRTLFISDNMRRAFDDDFLAWLGVEANGKLIAHRAGRHEERGLFPKHCSRHLLKAIHGGIFTVDIVSHVRVRHGLSHGASGFCDRIAAQVDHQEFASIPQDCVSGHSSKFSL